MWHHGSFDYSRTPSECQARKRILCVINCFTALQRRVLPRLTSPSVAPNPHPQRAATSGRPALRTTIETPMAVSTIPTNMIAVKASANSSHAIIAVVGGTR